MSKKKPELTQKTWGTGDKILKNANKAVSDLMQIGGFFQDGYKIVVTVELYYGEESNAS